VDWIQLAQERPKAGFYELDNDLLFVTVFTDTRTLLPPRRVWQQSLNYDFVLHCGGKA
jgi:hypothetical protein